MGLTHTIEVPIGGSFRALKQLEQKLGLDLTGGNGGPEPTMGAKL